MTKLKQALIALFANAVVLAGCNALNQPADISKSVNASINELQAPTGHSVIGGMDFIIADPSKNLILKAVHPSPLSAYRGFFGCKHFSAANDYLASIGKETIRW